ncbi:NADPH dehydrogenase-like [Oppia nitens]|uniref:NADPH dehydrogenase-like n=1 Tax=Oppia nitens TaxID=1686743 RepID=UPI0023DA4764|nr:NADPH dehydrogenase-like [Oppia nitens]
MSKSVSKLFEPLTIRGQVLKNRIGVSPMVTWMADSDGQATDFHLAHYGQFALGGAGLVVLESTAVEARGRITPSDLGIWSDHQVDGLSRIARFLSGQGSLPGIQLAHSGRKGSTSAESLSSQSLAIGDGSGGWPTIAPSAIPFGAGISQVPIEATVDDLLTIRQSFVLAAVRAVRAGFQLIELHYGHGYLVNQFLSPVTNRRTDQYGGSLDNRMRLGLEIVADVRQAIPDNIILAVRISFSDYADNGWDLRQSIDLSKQLKQLGVDLLDVSSGGVVSGVNYSAINTPDQQHRASDAIQREAGIRTTVVGKIIDPVLAEKLLQSNCATIVLIGRAFLNDPHWPYKAADILNGQSFKYPQSYDWCIGWKAMYKWRQDLYTDQNDDNS